MVFEEFGVAGGVSDHLGDVHVVFEGGDLFRLDGGVGGFGDEEGAAVFVGEDGGFEGADVLGLLDDLLFVRADEGTEDWHGGDFADGGHILEGLGADLAKAFAGDEGFGAFATADGFGDADHEAAVGDDAQGAGDCEDDALLDGGEGYEVEVGVVLVDVEDLGEFLGFLPRASFYEGEAVEVDEGRSAAATHHAPGGDGGVDAARHEDGDTSASADREAAICRVLVGPDEGFTGHEVDADVEVWVLEVDAGTGLDVDHVAEFDVEFVGGHGERFVGAVR